MGAVKPLKINWTFTRPIIKNDHPIHLDALLAWAAVKMAEEQGMIDHFDAQDDLPIAKTPDGIWKASMLVKSNSRSSLLFPMTKPFNVYLDDADIYYEKKNVHFTPGTGRFKAFDLRVQAEWCSEINAWCIGDEKKIKKLLSKITNIGKLARNNFGAIKECRITEDPMAEELWQVRTLRLPENAPVRQGYAKAMRVCTPPYWDKTKSEICQVPVDPQKICANL